VAREYLVKVMQAALLLQIVHLVDLEGVVPEVLDKTLLVQ
jgi:hypothetical protein